MFSYVLVLFTIIKIILNIHIITTTRITATVTVVFIIIMIIIILSMFMCDADLVWGLSSKTRLPKPGRAGNPAADSCDRQADEQLLVNRASLWALFDKDCLWGITPSV